MGWRFKPNKSKTNWSLHHIVDKGKDKNLLLFLSAVLLDFSIKGFNNFSMRQSNENQNNAVMNYIIFNPRSPVTLDLYEAEPYEPAIIVQSLVGNLVYYSNQGRYEPRLAKSWKRIDSKTWEFELNSGLKCENGETIDASSFYYQI